MAESRRLHHTRDRGGHLFPFGPFGDQALPPGGRQAVVSRPALGGRLQAVQQIFSRFDPLIASVHTFYDNDAQHGRNAPQQTRWDGFIQTAFARPRNPPMSAPGSTPYKVPLLDCLRSGGVNI